MFCNHLFQSLGSAAELSIETGLYVRGIDLRRRISEASNIAVDCVKLIASGSVIKDDTSLEQQNIKVCCFLFQDKAHANGG